MYYESFNIAKIIITIILFNINSIIINSIIIIYYQLNINN